MVSALFFTEFLTKLFPDALFINFTKLLEGINIPIGILCGPYFPYVTLCGFSSFISRVRLFHYWMILLMFGR